MTAIQALLAFTGWTLALVGWVAAYRIARFVKGAPINSWPRGAARQDDPPIMRRIEDAHANCLENLPVFAVLVLAGAALGKLPSIDVLAACVFTAALPSRSPMRGAPIAHGCTYVPPFLQRRSCFL